MVFTCSLLPSVTQRSLHTSCKSVHASGSFAAPTPQSKLTLKAFSLQCGSHLKRWREESLYKCPIWRHLGSKSEGSCRVVYFADVVDQELNLSSIDRSISFLVQRHRSCFALKVKFKQKQLQTELTSADVILCVFKR